MEYQSVTLAIRQWMRHPQELISVGAAFYQNDGSPHHFDQLARLLYIAKNTS